MTRPAPGGPGAAGAKRIFATSPTFRHPMRYTQRMDPVFALSTYFVVWWTTLFAILPLGVQSHHQAGIEVPGGGDPGAPVNPNLKRKFITTTWVSAIVWVVLAVVIRVFGPMLAPRA